MSLDDFMQHLYSAFFFAWVEVGVCVPRHFDFGMAETARNFLYVDPLIVKRLSRHKRCVSAHMQAERALRNMLCKQYLTTFDKVKITGISLIKSVNNNYWLLPQDRIRQC